MDVKERIGQLEDIIAELLERVEQLEQDNEMLVEEVRRLGNV